jgi:hypothetical protein
MPRGFRSALPAIVRLFLVLPFAALLASCVTYSVHPLYDAKSEGFDANLLGRWENPGEKNGSGSFVFAKGNGDFYDVTMIDPNADDPSLTASYEAHAVRLNGRLFLDVVQTAVEVAGHHANAAGIRSHMIIRATADGDKLSIGLLDDDWLQKGFDSGKITLAHETSDDSDNPVVLTASTSELQRFVAAHANDDQAFPPSDPLTRAK